MPLSIRLAQPGDAQGVARVMVASWHAAYTGIVPKPFLDAHVTMDEYLPRFERIVASPAKTCHIAVIHGHIIGVFAIGKLRDEDATAEDGELFSLYLHPDYFSKGYGRQMIKAALAKLAQANFSTVSLWVLAQNIRARRFYEACGFVPDGLEKTIDLGAPLVEMRYRLAFLPHGDR